MKQLVQNLGNGETVVLDVPAPGPRHGALLIRTTHSLISAGTERMLVNFGKAGWIGKAQQQPEKVSAVISKMRTNGLGETWRAVRAKLGQPIPVGYCQVGRVVDAGDATEDGRLITEGSGRTAECIGRFRIGDRVVSNGPHAEVVSIQHDLCVRIPDEVSDDAATFTPLGAIALQGISLLSPARGERVVVTGLGLIGQLAVRILRAMGCEVLGLDPSLERRKLAEQSGAVAAEGDPVTAALSWTQGKGVAGVLITASTSSNEVINQAARSCCWRGKVVLVGVVGLQLNRADFYRNEVSFQVSCSYGIRDARSTNSARANFQQVLTWMADGLLPVEDLITHRFEFQEAPSAYGALADRTALGVLLSYSESGDAVLGRSIALGVAHAKSGIGVALIGAGNFATRTLLPAMTGLARPPSIVAVVSRLGTSAVIAAQASGAAKATTDVQEVLTDASVQAVFITTRHDGHAWHALSAMRTGKHVWVEKPLALKEADVDAIVTASREANRVLMVGFNRRFSPMATALKQAITGHSGTCAFKITVNAGRLDPDHWSLNPVTGGGRIVGEACHFVDLLRYWIGRAIERIECIRRDTDGQDSGAFKLHFAGGHTGLIDYRTDLSPDQPKELIEVRGSSFSATIQNWSRLRTTGLGGLNQGSLWSRAPKKGHPEALAAFLDAIKSGVCPIPLEEIVEVSKSSIAMQAMGLRT